MNISVALTVLFILFPTQQNSDCGHPYDESEGYIDGQLRCQEGRLGGGYYQETAPRWIERRIVGVEWRI